MHPVGKADKNLKDVWPQVGCGFIANIHLHEGLAIEKKPFDIVLHSLVLAAGTVIGVTMHGDNIARSRIPRSAKLVGDQMAVVIEVRAKVSTVWSTTRAIPNLPFDATGTKATARQSIFRNSKLQVRDFTHHDAYA